MWSRFYEFDYLEVVNLIDYVLVKFMETSFPIKEATSLPCI